MSPSANIVLIGFMGTGKSVVGKRLSTRLGRVFLDTDVLIAGRAGRSISAIFTDEGEAGFRDLETAVLRPLLGIDGAVIATGGGILGRDENVALLRQIGLMVWLTAQPEVILERTHPWEDRPMLSRAPDPSAAVMQLLGERTPRYALADLCVDTSERTVEEVVEEICRQLS